ncbi:G protein-regulated inducer of neurite outgrowth 1 isoform X3 [Ixodes scapularis]|uniref:G protein-regulated inducer of neurite outgrowth 1 isoform X2 n=1 Tax=Ixodes scapularis TaxID=6945 RepID=UPI001C38B5E3|nr:G protein-regulated inducer of neurite outgrowth 1 isoform X2 [Ixodes scapularis]XP_040075646.2 G protein-regulated inducer of neurite outgrowth 1 isoform X3 [Ixodes scapularis]
MSDKEVYNFIPTRTGTTSQRLAMRKTTVRPFRLSLPMPRNTEDAEPPPGTLHRANRSTSKRSLTFASSRKASPVSSPADASQMGLRPAVSSRDDEASPEELAAAAASAAGSHHTASLEKSPSSAASKIPKIRSPRSRASRSDGGTDPKGSWEGSRPSKRRQLTLELPSPISPPAGKSGPAAARQAALMSSTPLPGTVPGISRGATLRSPRKVFFRRDLQAGSSRSHGSHSPALREDQPEEPIPAGGEADQGNGAAGAVEKDSAAESESQEGEARTDVVINDSGLGLGLTILRDTFADKIAQAKSEAAKEVLRSFQARAEGDIIKYLDDIRGYRAAVVEIHKEKRKLVRLRKARKAIEDDIADYVAEHNLDVDPYSLGLGEL